MKKPCLSAAAAADYKNILISCILRYLRAAVHCEPFRIREKNIVIKALVNIRGYIRRRTPARRAVFNAVPVFLSVLALYIYRAFNQKRGDYSD